MTLAAAVLATIGAAFVVGYHVGVRVRAHEVERAALAVHAASLAAQTAAVEVAAAHLVIAERERFDARLRGLIDLVAPDVQGDMEHNTHGGRMVAAARALYEAQET